jgi:Tol biopolymer transport system component/C-terminal processing protease CtpA/Prc
MKYINILALFFSTILLSAQESELLRFPSISPDASQIAFSYQGDIWTVPVAGGVARRLTIHESYESHPQWSPDGRKIVFMGNRYGNNDIFVIDNLGSPPRRLTFHSTGDDDPQWRGNDRIIFSSNRLFRQVEWDAEVQEIALAGGTPQRIMGAVAKLPTASPNGRFIAYVEGSCRDTREAYTGPARRDIWLYDTQTDNYRPLVENEAQDNLPHWGTDNLLYYLSAVDGRYNIYRQQLDNEGNPRGKAEKMTNFKDMGIRHFDVSADGNMLVFERNSGIYTMATDKSSKPRLVKAEVSIDYRFDPAERKTQSKGAIEMALSPNGKQILFSVRGELFVMLNDKDKKRAVQLTHSAARDQDAHWLNDTTIVFRSDLDGNYDIFQLRSADPDESNLFKTLKWRTTRLTQTPVDEQEIVLSPDASKVAIMRGRGQLVVADISETGLSNEKILHDGWASANGIRWSPDSKWLAYSMADLDFNSEIYIHAADGSGQPVNVSMHPRGDYSPYWSADGSKLAFQSIRNNGDTDLWFAWLKEEDWQKTKRDWEDDEEEDQAEDKNAVPADSITYIDFKNIHQRLEQVTLLPGNEGDLVISPDGETFFFTSNNGGRNGSPGNSALHSIKWDGSDLETLSEKATIRTMNIDKDGKFLYMLKSDGTFAKLKIDGKKMESLAFSAQMNIDHYGERQQVFDEAWRSLRDGFYDPEFHGQDWNALKATYRPIALAASTEQDFRDIFNTMLGQLNASHMGMSGPNPEETQSDRTGLLGVELEAAPTGLKIMRVVPNSPADRSSSKLAVGDVITAVNGTRITTATNIYELLNGTADERTLLELTNSGNTREVVIRPTTSLRSELYEEWVEERKRLTEKYSNGRLGYIHIQGMNWPSFERFERELTASGLGKEGMVIDVRYNGGGWTTDMLMTVLNVRQHAYTIPRGAVSSLDKQHQAYADHYPYGERLPQAALTLPSVALCNQNSYSNAEIFSHAFKTLDHGTLVGMPTFGAVISTGGQGLLNGNFVRMPFRAWYVKATGENMELGPAVPDVVLENAPDSKAKGEDEQLRKAVEVLLSEMK